jgi:hypothetical protein
MSHNVDVSDAIARGRSRRDIGVSATALERSRLVRPDPLC